MSTLRQIKKRAANKSNVEADEPAKKKSMKVVRPGFGEEKYSETEYYFENGSYT